MELNKWNQMFIDSVEHWEVDALQRLIEGDFIRVHADQVIRWHSDGARYIMDCKHCSLCDMYKTKCELCPLSDNGDNCCHEFDVYYENPCADTAQHMIDWLIYVAQNKSRYEI